MARATLAYCCEVVTCDDCRRSYGDEEYGGLIHLAPGEAPDSGWRVIDGKDVCEDCAAIRECVATGGHKWGGWHGPYAPSSPVRHRYCDRCTASEQEASHV